MQRVLQLSWNERRWLYATGVLVLIMFAGSLLRGHASSEVDQAVERHWHATARDEARILHAAAAAEQASQHEHELVHGARTTEVSVKLQGNRADSLRVEVAGARAPRDSAIAWEYAYDARALQVRGLEIVAAARDTALTWADLRADSLNVALAVSKQRAERADSVIRLAVGGCRIGRLLPCPSRWTVGVVTAVAAAALAVRYRH